MQKSSVESHCQWPEHSGKKTHANQWSIMFYHSKKCTVCCELAVSFPNSPRVKPL